MNPGNLFVRSWLPDESKTSYPDSLTIYDAGNIQGWFLKTSSGNTSWTVFQIDVRMDDKGEILESGEILNQSSSTTSLHIHYALPSATGAAGTVSPSFFSSGAADSVDGVSFFSS